jgi:hypothetical protein
VKAKKKPTRRKRVSGAGHTHHMAAPQAWADPSAQRMIQLLNKAIEEGRSFLFKLDPHLGKLVINIGPRLPVAVHVRKGRP